MKTGTELGDVKSTPNEASCS